MGRRLQRSPSQADVAEHMSVVAGGGETHGAVEQQLARHVLHGVLGERSTGQNLRPMPLIPLLITA
jgi:hypothetical protein